jgi:membrane protease subunit HflK
MSWNEPGGNKKDPWSGRDQQSSPPDVDEVLRTLRDNISKLFGGRSSGGRPDGSPGRAFGLLLGIVLTIWALTGIYIVDEGNRGVVTRFGKYAETTMPGPHWRFPWPIDHVDIVNVEQQRFIEVGYRSGGRQQAAGSVPKEALMLTQDENIVDIRLAVQYQIKNAKDYLFHVLEPDATLKQVTESAQRSVIGRNTMDFVLTEGRATIAEEIKGEIQQLLDQYQAGIRVITVNFVDAQPPEEVQSAFEDAIKAREDEQRLKNEAEAYANEVVPKARGAAARLLEESEGYKQRNIAKAQGEAGRFKQLLAEYEKAPDITRERLYIDTIESVLQRSNILMLDVKGGNNLIYLPIDKLQRQTTALDAGREIDSTPLGAVDASDGGGKVVRRPVTVRGRDGRGQ